MGLTVMKFGGSSLAGQERLARAAARIAAEQDGGNRVIAVLSARGDLTDRLLDEARELNPALPARELDLLLSVGEQAAVAQMALLLRHMGYAAEGFTGWQAGIWTDGAHGDARIVRVSGGRIVRALDAGKIVLVAGFQGISPEGAVTTLGRGGSDTTAVALAAYLHADVCRIYTDVDGVYTADPRVLPEARHLKRVSYGDMLEMAQRGAKVLHSRCVELAAERDVEFEVCSSLTEAEGTRVGAGEARAFCGIAVRETEAGTQISLIGSACGEEAEETMRLLLAPLGGKGFVRSERCIAAYVPRACVRAAARALHEGFFQ